jgi:hypothetical protein
MVSKKDKDAESGLQVLGILVIVWSIGFYYFGSNGDLAGIGLDQWAISCCNIINILLIVILLASWRYTKRENRVKDYLKEYFKTNSSVSLKHLIDEFKLSYSAAYKSLGIWIIESKTKGDYDPKTGVFTREPVEIDSSEVIDLEFEEVIDESPAFCPNCGKKLEIIGLDKPTKCDDCGTSF